jgi:hypothetical protein
MGSVFIAGQALAQKVSIESLKAAGSGCPASSRPTGRLVHTDKDGLPDRLVVSFPSYVAKQGAGLSIANRRRNCAMVLLLNLPEGLQYRIASVRYHGHASLPVGASGLLQSDYDFPFASKIASFQATLRGPLKTDFHRQAQRQPQDLVWSPCHRDIPLVLRTQIVLSGPRTVSASLRATRHAYDLVWRHCGR